MPWDEKGPNDKKDPAANKDTGGKNNAGQNHGPWGNGPWGQSPDSPKPMPPEFDAFVRNSQKKIEQLFKNRPKGAGNGGGGGKNNGSGNSNGGGQALPGGSNFLIAAVGLVVLAFWILSGVYTVNTKEAGVVLRFGKYDRTATPGLNYRLPFPIESVIKISVTDRYRTEIGANTEKSRVSRSRVETKTSEGLLMLTGDENLVDVNFEVQWQIENAQKYLFNIYDPQLTVRNAAESAMREIIGTTALTEILSAGRGLLQQKTKELLQNILDSYDAGIHIETINMRGVPPTSQIRVDNIVTGDDGEMKSEAIDTTVDQAFKDVQAAIINKEEIINMAIARSNEVIPEARGQGQKLIQDAQGYKEQVIAKAEGEANRFNSVYNEYRKSKDVTKKRIYLETMEQIMDGMDKVIMDGKNSGVLPYLPLKELGHKQ